MYCHSALWFIVILEPATSLKLSTITWPLPLQGPIILTEIRGPRSSTASLAYRRQSRQNFLRKTIAHYRSIFIALEKRVFFCLSWRYGKDVARLQIIGPLQHPHLLMLLISFLFVAEESQHLISFLQVFTESRLQPNY